ncbi:MAG: DUF349 domain-containing protein [Bacteroidaceae bacterium]|nr:DUF349 domain-containing protein [Bacteroidaceae bacterium]
METNESNESKPIIYNDKHAVVERLTAIAQSGEVADKSEMDLLKQVFYKLHFADLEKARKEYTENGGDPTTFIIPTDPDEQAFKAQFNLIKERRAAQMQEMEAMRQENYTKKLAIVERIKTLLQNPEEANQAYQEVKELQQQWKEIGSVPPEKSNDLWKSYQLFTEQYYDILKMNNEFREYDFKKNLEIKTRLCEEAEKLAASDDVISASLQLQQLHQEFRNCGPVAKDLREDIWKRFKEASTVINKRHQQHFESIKANEEQNLEKKTAICEQLEAINLESLTNAALWNDMSQKVLALQAEWKTIGFAPQKHNVKIFERFRSACDNFFATKAAFFKDFKQNQSENLKKKIALCEKAEALKESTEWKKTGDMLAELQKEWKSIGAVARKDSDEIWKRFMAACDAFFENRNKAMSSQRNEENTNLKKKKELIQKLKELKEEAANDIQVVREVIKEWNETGHVPFREKDKLHEEFHGLVDELFKAANVQNGKKRVNRFKESLKEKSGNTLGRERERLVRTYEAMKNDLKTYENNLGFLTLASKNGNSLIDELNRKMEKLKEDIEVTYQKIKALDEQQTNQE